MDLRYGGQSLGCVTLSIGVAGYPAHSDKADLLLKFADQALYDAKKSGRDRVVVEPT
jgi:diguanylate cyclase (GGDEF)-like protein